MMSERAQTLASETGAAVYWQSADEVTAQIQTDIETLAGIDKLLAE